METLDTQFDSSHIQYLLNFKLDSSTISKDKSDGFPDLKDDDMRQFHEDVMFSVKFNEWENIIVILSELKSQIQLPPKYSFYLAQAYYYVKLYIGTINLCCEYIKSFGVTVDICLLISKCFCKVGLLEGSRTWLSYAKKLKAKRESVEEIESLIASKREKMRIEEKTFVLYMKNDFFLDAIDSVSTIYKNALPGQVSEMTREDWANLVKEVDGDPEKLHELRIKSDILTESIKLSTKFGMFGMHSYQHDENSRNKQDIPIHQIGFNSFRQIIQYLDLPDIANLRKTCRLFNEWGADNEIWKDIYKSRSLAPIENIEKDCYFLFKDYSATISIINQLFNRIMEITTVDVLSDVLKKTSKKYYLSIYNFWEELSSFLNVILASPELTQEAKELSFKILRILEAALKSPFLKDHEVDFIFELLILFATKNQLFKELPPQSLIFARGYPDTELVSTYIALCFMKLNGIFLHDIEDIPQEFFLENELYPKLSGIWRGNFYFNIFTQTSHPEADMYMNLKFNEDGTVTGNGIDTYNKYEIKDGQYDTKNICFVKKYASGEEVVYIGVSNPKGFGGVFKTDGTSGYFIIHKVPHLDKEKEKLYYNNAVNLINVQKRSLKSHEWKKERSKLEQLHLEMLSYTKMKQLLEKKVQTFSFMKNIERSLESIPEQNYTIYSMPVNFNEDKEKDMLRKTLYSKLTYLTYFCLKHLIAYNESKYNKFMEKLEKDQVSLEDLEYWSIFLNIPFWGFKKDSLISILKRFKVSESNVTVQEKQEEKEEEKTIIPPVEKKKKTKKRRKHTVQIEKESSKSSSKFWYTVGAVTAAVSVVSVLTYRFFKKD